MFGSRITGLCSCLIALIVSTLFRYPYINPKFVVSAVAVFVLSALCFAQPTKLIFPKVKNLPWLLILLVFCVILSSLAQVPAERVTGLSHIFMSALLIWITASFARDEKTDVFILRFIEIQMPILLYMILALAYQSFFTARAPAYFFHGFNIAGGFAAIATLQCYFYALESKNLVRKRIAYALSIIGFALVAHYKARAALLGLCAALTFTSYSYFDLFQIFKKNKTRDLYRYILITLGLVLTIAAGYVFFQKGFASMEIRFSFWGNTLCLIKDYPWGIGPGAFEYVFHAYNGRCFPGQEISESQIIDHPHNMLLEFMANIGVLGCITLIGIFFLLYKSFLKSTPKTSLTFKWTNASLLLILSNAIFEFPQGTAYSLFYLSIVLGVLLASIKSTQSLPSFFKSLHLALSFVIASIFILKGASNILTLRPDIKDNFSIACSLDKENWRACYRVALKAIQEKNLDEAKRLIDKLALSFDDHYLFLVLKGQFAEAQGDLPSACKFFKQYDDRFKNKSLLSKSIQEKCTNK